MACASFEDLLLDYRDLPASQRAEVAAHLSGCPDCREYLSLLAELDSELTAHYSGVTAGSGMQARIHSLLGAQPRLARPSYLPEVLDFIGWSAIVTIVFSLVWMLIPKDAISLPNAWPLTGSLAVAAAAWIGFRAHADLK